MKYSLLWFPFISDVLIAFWDLENIVHRSVNFINIVNKTEFHETVYSHELENEPLIFLIHYNVVHSMVLLGSYFVLINV